MSRLEKVSSFRSAASTSQEGLEERPTRVCTNQLLKVTLFSSEWRSLKGGLSTVNRELAIELAKHPNVEVCVYLPKCSEEDKNVASGHNVQLIEAEELPGFEPIDWLTSLPKGHLPHCLIGHGLHLGRQIQLIKQHHNCKWIQVVHTAPEELGMYKSYEEAISKGEQKHQAEVKLCELADQVVAVGPKLADAYSRYLRFSGKDEDVINLTPSIFTEFQSVQQATEEGSKFRVLVFGRGDHEDFILKGYDIAVEAVSKLKDTSYELLFVGAPTGKEDDVRAKLLKYGISPRQLIVRRFKESREELAKLFCEVDLAIMPSRTEGFGLTALEALSAGLPVLVSGNSGLGDALKKVPSGIYHVVDSEDPKEWAKAIKIVRQKGREVRLEDANLLCEKFAAKYSWQKQCFGLVEKMQLLTFGSFSPGQPSVDGSLSHGACATSEEPVAVTFHHKEEERTKQDICQATRQPLTVECNPVLSHVPSQGVEKPTHLEALLEDSLESGEGPTKKGKQWLRGAAAQSSHHHKGTRTCRPFRKLLKDEYNRRSNLKPLLWESAIELPLDQVYTRLEVKWRKKSTHQLTEKEIPMYGIFNLDNQEEKSGWRQKLRFVFKNGSQEKAKMVLVEGSPGIGKTTFCLKIANDWAMQAIPKKHDFPAFKLILLLKCRDMEGDIIQAIDDQLLPEDITEKKKKELLDYIRDEKKQEKILIILDGLDELPKVAEKFVEKLLRRKVLSRCSVLATSRQEKGIEIRQRHVLDTLLQINGFTIEDASVYIRKHFRTVGQSEADLLKGKRLIEAIQENTFLHALQNNPLNLLLLCIVFEEYKGELPSNRTDLYQIIYRCLLRRYCSKNNMEIDKKDDVLEKRFERSTLVLGELAWRCLLEERPCFLQEELEELEKVRTNGASPVKGVSAAKSVSAASGVSAANGASAVSSVSTARVGLVFMEASVKKLNPKHEYHFLHRTFQEFLAATYLVQLMKENINIFDKFRLNKKDIASDYRQVFLFAAGIPGKDGTTFFRHIGEFLYRSWNWHSSDEDCRFLIELLNESGAPNDLTMVSTVCQCIPLPQSLELSLEDRHTLRLVRYACEASSVASNELILTNVHAFSGYSAGDLYRILESNDTLKAFVISTDDMTSLLANTLLKGLSSNSSLSSLTLKSSKSIPAAMADTLGKGLSLCISLKTVKFKLFSNSNSWARDVSKTGLLKSTQLESVDLEYYGVPDTTAVQAFKLMVSKRSLISFSLTLFGDMEDCLASALSEGLSEETTLSSFSVVIHGSLSNHGATLLASSFLLNRTLQSLAFKVLGDLPEHWAGVVDKIHQLTAKKSWKSLTLHPNMKGKFDDASFSLLNPISRVGLLKKTLTINLWGELSIHNVDILGDLLLQTLPLSSLTLNLNGKVSNNVADCLVNFFVTNNVLLSLTFNLSGEITSSGQTALQRLHREGQLQSFILNVDGLVTEDWESLSAENNFLTSSALQLIHISNLTPNEVREILSGSKSVTELSVAVDLKKFFLVGGEVLGRGLSNNKSLTTFSLTVHNYAGTTGSWEHCLSEGLSNNKSLTTFSLTVHNYAGTAGSWGHGLGEGLSNNESLTTFSLTVYNYDGTAVIWGLRLGEGLSNNKSLTTFSLTVHDYAGTTGSWGHRLGEGLSNNKSLSTFSLTVLGYADTADIWGHGLGEGLSNNKSLTTFSLTVHDYDGTAGSWGHSLGEGLSNNKSLTTFSLTVHDYDGTAVIWGLHLGEGLSNNKSLTTLSLTVHDYAGTAGSCRYGLRKGLSNNKSLTTFSLTIHSYTDTERSWGCNMANSLAKSCSLTTLRLAINDHTGVNRDVYYLSCKSWEEIESLTLLSISVSFYGEDSVKLH